MIINKNLINDNVYKTRQYDKVVNKVVERRKYKYPATLKKNKNPEKIGYFGYFVSNLVEIGRMVLKEKI